MRKKSYDGYFTVEAALLMPMVLLFTTTMIFVAFFMYDRSMLEHCAYEAALRGSSSLIMDNDEAYERTLEAAVSLIDDKIFAAGDVSYDITVTGNEIKVIYECDVNVPLLSWLHEYVPGADFHIKADGCAPRVRAVDDIRAVERIKKIGEDEQDGELTTQAVRTEHEP